ncbi:hypothetical protein [Niallia sp. 01092]|uniref:hypothetical protein n=1 Tax=unclassified Niallia TaxID=2837522 RepID=UPI003FCF3BC7
MKRLRKFSLELEPNKTRLVESDRFTSKHAQKKRKKLETIYLLGFTHYGKQTILLNKLKKLLINWTRQLELLLMIQTKQLM